jgi:hypothetical protein
VITTTRVLYADSRPISPTVAASWSNQAGSSALETTPQLRLPTSGPIYATVSTVLIRAFAQRH